MRLIDGDALKGRFRKRLQHYEYREDDYGIGRCGGMTDAMEMIDNSPTIDAILVVHARWQGVSPFVDTKECSNCRYNILSEELETPYCPWCGAKMDGEQEAR